MSQILYEETGCIMPRNMHLYDRRTKALSKYGLSEEEMVYMFSIMTAMAHARRQRVAQNLDEAFDVDEDVAETEEETAEDNTAAYREEIKRLRNALHDAEKAARDARKALDESKVQAMIEHRELADLRELVFHQDEEDLKLIGYVPVKPHVPLYIIYFTLWPDESGALQTWPDIYGYDKVILEHLKPYLP